MFTSTIWFSHSTFHKSLSCILSLQIVTGDLCSRSLVLFNGFSFGHVYIFCSWLLLCYVVFLPWGCRTDVEVVLKEFKIDLGLRNIRKSSLKIIRVWKVSLVYFFFFYFKFEKKVPECTCLFIDFQNLKSVQAQIHFLPHGPGLKSLRYCIKSSLRISFLGLYNVLSQKAFLLR